MATIQAIYKELKTMNQKVAVEKIYIEMVDRNLCASVIEHEIKFYLNMMFAIGYDSGKLWQVNMRKIIKINKAGERVGKYESLSAAARNGFNKQALSNTLAGRAETCGGFHWRYEN